MASNRSDYFTTIDDGFANVFSGSAFAPDKPPANESTRGALPTLASKVFFVDFGLPIRQTIADFAADIFAKTAKKR